MTAKDRIETGWTSLPADCAPIAGNPISRLRELEDGISNVAADLMRFGRISRDPPAWVHGRVADWWLSDGEYLAVPLVWVGDELVATVIVWRDENRAARKERRQLVHVANTKRAQREGAARRAARYLRKETRLVSENVREPSLPAPTARPGDNGRTLGTEPGTGGPTSPNLP